MKARISHCKQKIFSVWMQKPKTQGFRKCMHVLNKKYRIRQNHEISECVYSKILDDPQNQTYTTKKTEVLTGTYACQNFIQMSTHQMEHLFVGLGYKYIHYCKDYTDSWQINGQVSTVFFFLVLYFLIISTYLKFTRLTLVDTHLILQTDRYIFKKCLY